MIRAIHDVPQSAAMRKIGTMVDRPVMDLGLVAELPPEDLDLQPFGIIRLDRAGTVLTFNRYEESLAKKSRRDVIGRNFFHDIAPCTKVKDFHGHDKQPVSRGRRPPRSTRRSSPRCVGRTTSR